MRLAYVAHWDVSRESGVLKKIADQLRAWDALGHEARLFVLTPERTIWEGIADLDVAVTPRKGPMLRFLTAEALVRAVRAWNPGAVYLRFQTYYPAFERLERAIPTVLEINADDLAESRVMHGRGRRLYHRLTRARQLRAASGLACVTRELAARYARFGKPTVAIGNGIDLSRYPVLPAPSNDSPRLFFMGLAGHPWHGLDKIAGLAGAFPEWRFDLVGVTAADVGVPLPANVTAHGALPQSAYVPLMARADVALGTLALHRNGINEASTLKVREYLARGLPTIIGYDDTDFPDPPDFLLRLPNTDDNVATRLPEIAAFVERSRGTRVPRAAIEHLDTRWKERERLDFFEAIAIGALRGAAVPSLPLRPGA